MGGPGHECLLIALGAAVPLRVLELERRGGPTDADHERVRGHAEVIASGSDGMLFRGNKEGHAADVFNRLADALAVMAFAPGGVRFAGERWAAGPHNRQEGR